MYSAIIKNVLLRNLYVNRTETEQMLLLCSLFSIGLSFFRIIYTGELMFLFLNWNLFLAFIPYAITTCCRQRVSWMENNFRFGAVVLIWLLFLPNSFYIITDLFHLQPRAEIPLWFDLALLFSFAWNGLLLGVLSVRQMEKLLQIKWPLKKATLFVPLVMFLISFGVYVGRYLRYNSWDVVRQPLGLAEDVVLLFINPVQNRFDWSMIICFAMLLSLIYASINKLAKH